MTLRPVFLLSACFGVLSLPLAAQRMYTAQDYAQAERWMPYNEHALVHHTIEGVTYLPDGRIFYRDPGTVGVSYMIADPLHGTVAKAFDPTKLVASLRTASQRAVEATHLKDATYVPDAAGSGFTIDLGWSKLHCVTDALCTVVSSIDKDAAMQKKPAGHSKVPFDVSPDKKLAVFIKDNNLWVRTEATGEEHALTTDGVNDYGYATDNAGWQHSDAPIVVWSADSKKIATFQMDQRKTGMMYLVSVTNRHPALDAWRYPFAGDKDVPTIERVVIDVDTAKVVRLKMPPDQHRSTLCDDISCKGGSGWDDVQFASDGKTLAFVSTSRDHKDEWFRTADTATGDVREVYHTHVPTYYESGQGMVNWKYLSGTNELIWYSEEDDWGQLYLYDATTGKLKNKITRGEGCVTELLHVDEKNRVLYFVATAKEKGEDPYYRHFYRVDFDGQHQQLLTPEDADHAVTPSPDGSTFVDVASTPQTPQTVVVRDNTGRQLVELAKQDISPLLAAGWKPPMSFTVKARDGKTPLYGLLWKPSNFDEGKKYPIVNYVYAGPYALSCGSRAFSPASHDNQSLADLGFVVVCIDAMGTPFRSKSFHDAYASTAKDMADDTIPDEVAGIKQLGAKYAWIDLDRVGIWGHSGGGNATANAMFHYPDFYKVGISESGNHDNRVYEDDWDEKWGGLEVIDKDGKSNYDAQANEDFAKNLKGHLLLAYGTSDDNVPPNNTLLVVDALIKANKDFDLIAFPNSHHHYLEPQYMMRRRWDYFVKHLAGGVPPAEYKMKTEEEVDKLNNGPGY
jgi:dipeptidyl-peptidase 4